MPYAMYHRIEFGCHKDLLILEKVNAATTIQNIVKLRKKCHILPIKDNGEGETFQNRSTNYSTCCAYACSWWGR